MVGFGKKVPGLRQDLVEYVGVIDHHSMVICIDLTAFAVDEVVDVGGISVPFGESGNTGGLDKFDSSFIYSIKIGFSIIARPLAGIH